MNYDESNRILDKINRKPLIEETGWLGFFLGFMVTSLLFLFVLIPMVVEASCVGQETDFVILDG